MNTRHLCKLFLVVLTLHFVRSNKKWPNLQCLQKIQEDSQNIIKHHLKVYNMSCRNQRYQTKNITCILDWTLAGNCTKVQGLQMMIRTSSEMCTERITLKSPEKCTKKSFLRCWCGFLLENLQNS